MKLPSLQTLEVVHVGPAVHILRDTETHKYFSTADLQHITATEAYDLIKKEQALAAANRSGMNLINELLGV